MYNLVKTNVAKQSFNPDVTNQMVNEYLAQKGIHTRCSCGDRSWELAQPLCKLPKGKAILPVAVSCSSCGTAAKVTYLQIRKYFMN